MTSFINNMLEDEEDKEELMDFVNANFTPIPRFELTTPPPDAASEDEITLDEPLDVEPRGYELPVGCGYYPDPVTAHPAPSHTAHKSVDEMRLTKEMATWSIRACPRCRGEQLQFFTEVVHPTGEERLHVRCSNMSRAAAAIFKLREKNVEITLEQVSNTLPMRLAANLI